MPELLDELPVVLDEALVARAERRRDDDRHAVRDGEIAAREDAGDVEHRIVGEDHVVGGVRHHHRVGPALVGEAAVRELAPAWASRWCRRNGHRRRRRRARSCARTSAGRRARAAASVSRSLSGIDRRRPDPAPRGCAPRRNLARGSPAGSPRSRSPGVGPSATITLALVERIELAQLLGLEHPVDAAGDAGGERAEHHDVELRHGRQHVTARRRPPARRANGTGWRPGSARCRSSR